jgi:dTDP-3-amino-3,4,6-trideoxy-alpha-D-glucose transaminase
LSGVDAPPVPFVDLKATNAEAQPALGEALARVVESGWFLLGPELEAFEAAFAEYCGTRHCVGVGSGLAALELALRAGGVGPGDEVLVPAYTWIATWTAVSACGATPVGVDVLPGTYDIDPEAAAAAVTERTAAIVPVHLRGEPAAMDRLAALAERHGLFLLEDAAQAHGARYDGKRVGGLGDAGAFSFYPAKNLGALADGGAVTTDDGALAERLRRLRNYGMRNRYEIVEYGVNSRLPEMQAAALAAKLPHLDDWNERRRALAGAYLEALVDVGDLTLPELDERTEPVWHLFVVGHPRREELAAVLGRAGVQTLVHYPVLPHRAPPYRDDPAVPESFPVADRLAAHALTLPLYPQMDPDAPARIATLLR